MSVRLLLVGAGGIGRAAHLPALSRLRAEGRVELAGICDISATVAREAAAAFAIPDSGTDMIALARQTGSQAVVLAVPPGPHAALAIAALDHGLHVLSEKPPARTLAQAEAMAEAAERQPQLVTMIGFNRRYAPLYRRALDASLAVAPPHAFSARFTRAALGQPPSNTATDWLTSDGSHALDLAIATMGHPHRASVVRQRRGGGPDNIWHIQLESPSGGATLAFDFAAGRRIERFEWSGTDYDVALTLPERGEWSVRGRDVEHWASEPRGSEAERIAVDYGFAGEHRAFIDAIAGGTRPPVDFAYGVRFMRLIETLLDMASGEVRDLHESRRRGQPLTDPSQRGQTPGPGLTPRVLILQNQAARQRQFAADLLGEIADTTRLSLHAGDEWRAQLSSTHAIVTGWGGLALDQELLAQATALQLVVVVGSSARSVAPVSLLERGILVCTTADAVARSVAEHCLTLTLAGLRRLTEVDRQMHGGGWPPATTGRLDFQTIKRRMRGMPGMAHIKPLLKPLGQRLERHAGTGTPPIWRDLDGLIVGLIGWGHIARHFARLLAPFGCELLVYSAAADPHDLAAHGARSASLGELLGASHVVSLHRGLNDRTRGTLGAPELERLRPGTVLVNTARAALIDEQALTARLQRGDIVAALDVFEEEPLPAAHPLRRLPNAVLTPHNASSTPQCQRRAGTAALTIVRDWLAGAPVPALTADQIASMT